MIDAASLNPAFLDAFGETVYYDKGTDATTTTSGAYPGRLITAIVNRQPASGLPEAPAALRPFITVTVTNDATTGISAAELDTGKHSLYMRRRVGGDFETFRIHRIASQDDSMLTLEVR